MTDGPQNPGDLGNQNLKYLRFVDPEDPTKIIQLALENTGNLTADGIEIFGLAILPAGSGMNVIVVAKTIGSITFTGSGLDDMSNSGEFTGEVDVDYEIQIDGTGTPDTFRWSDDGGATWNVETVAITGLDQSLSHGVSIKFDATTGHTLAEKWEFTARAADPTTVIKTIVNATTLSQPPLAVQTIGPFDLRNVAALALTIGCIFDAAATLGISVEALTSADNINYDVDPYASTGLEPTFVAGGTAQKTSLIDTPVKFIKFVVTNLDTVKSTTGQPGYITKLER